MSDIPRHDSDDSDSAWDDGGDARGHHRGNSDSTVTPFSGGVDDETDSQPQDSSVQPTVAVQLPNEFSTSLPTLFSASISIRGPPAGGLVYPGYGREEACDQTSPQSYDSLTQPPVSVQSPNERSFSDTEYEVAAASHAPPAMSTPFLGATTVIEPGSLYDGQRRRAGTQDGSNGSNSGWCTVAANVIDWSGRADGGHSRDSSSGSTSSYKTAVCELDRTSVPYPMSGTHPNFPTTLRTVNIGSYHDHDYYGQQCVPSFNPASPPTGYYGAAQSPNYAFSPFFHMSQYHGSFGSPQSTNPATLIGSQQPVMLKTESFEPDLTSLYPSNIWQQPRTLDNLQENDDQDSSVDDGAKSPSPDSSLPNTQAAVELALPPVVPPEPFASDAARITPMSPPPHVDFGVQITSSGSIRMPRSSRNAVPVPIPNLAKKSLGRRFTCTVGGCGKSFNRGEHLKRHIRSIHTDDERKQPRPSALGVRNVRSSEMTSSKMFECLKDHGCLDLRSSIDPNRFSSCRVAEGGFGDVWKGQLNDGTDVALKVLRYGLVREDGSKSIKRAMREIYNWSKLEHKNVHRLLGVTMFQERLGMVSKWMEHGTLQQYLNQDGNINRHPLCLQMAEGVAYLHNVNMIHGDLKACNVLVSSDGVLKLTDFDYSIISDCSLVFSATTRMGGGTLRWMAPELVIDDEPTERNKKTDIYALGMTFLETITNALPYSECRRDAQIYGKLARREYPRQPIEHFPNTGQSGNPMWDLLVRCWDYDPGSRPTASQVLGILHTFDSDTICIAERSRG